MNVVWQGEPVGTWADFHSVVKRPGKPLLAQLDEYADSLLVAGCQRSGTTAVARLFKRARGIADYGFGRDDELDGALLLSGYVERFTNGRHCFQTTYLNDRFGEYFDHTSYRLVWMLREPRSVVYSMLHNWSRGSLNRLFDACGRDRLPRAQRRSWLGARLGPSRLEKACASYVAKTAQTFDLLAKLGDRMAIVDYDDLVSHQDTLLPKLFAFADAPFDDRLLRHLHGNSVHKRERLRPHEAALVEQHCMPVYRAARGLCTIGTGGGHD